MPTPLFDAHIWLRAETRENESRAALTPYGTSKLVAAGAAVTVESSPTRVFPDEAYIKAGATIAPASCWPDAPRDAIILGLKELPESGTALEHAHIMFGHAFKGQTDANALLKRFQAGDGTLLDLEYLTDNQGRRVAAFGYWAGFVGAALSLMDWAAIAHDATCPPAHIYPTADTLIETTRAQLVGIISPRTIVVGALGRVGQGAQAMCNAVGCPVTSWDMNETKGRDAFPEILDHDMFLNAILATKGGPVFVPKTALSAQRNLRVIGDIACDPNSAYNPIPVYDAVTSWDVPCTRVAEDPVLDVMAVDNLPSLLPKESAEDFAAQLLPYLLDLKSDDMGVWGRARETFMRHVNMV